MTSATLNGANGVHGDVVAAAIAAVQAYLENEAIEEPASQTRGISSWRMALANRSTIRGFGANVSWRGRD